MILFSSAHIWLV